MTFLFWLWRFGNVLSRVLPLPVSYAGASFIGQIVYYLWPRGRRSAQENMRRVLGEGATHAQVSSVARRSFRNYGKYVVDFARVSSILKEDLGRKMLLEGWSAVEEAHRRGKGTIIMGLHQGNWDMGIVLLAQRGYPVTVVAETLPHPGFHRFITHLREQLGVRIIPMESGVRDVIAALRRNEIVAILIDQPKATADVPVRFFNRLTRVPAGAATLALRTGAALVPGTAIRLKDGRFLGIMHGPLVEKRTADLRRDIQQLTQQAMTVLEQFVREYPEQWFVFRPLWAES